MKFILDATNALSSYLQGKEIDICTARDSSFKTIKSLKTCRNEDNFLLLWQKAELISNKIRECIVDTDFSIKEARISRKNAKKKVKKVPWHQNHITEFLLIMQHWTK